LVRKGRLEFLSQFPSLARPEMQAVPLDPGDRATFDLCKLDLSERRTHAPVYNLFKDLLRIRREEPVFRAQHQRGVDGAVLSPEAFLLRFFEGPNGASGKDRLLLVNLGRDLEFDPAPDPLLAPPQDMQWQLLWSSEDPRYGGSGTAVFDEEDALHIPGHAALVMIPCVK
jgi:maltooligosyltrehalose trehalohydrolase